jgi:hypothetical protein
VAPRFALRSGYYRAPLSRHQQYRFRRHQPLVYVFQHEGEFKKRARPSGQNNVRVTQFQQSAQAREEINGFFMVRNEGIRRYAVQGAGDADGGAAASSRTLC